MQDLPRRPPRPNLAAVATRNVETLSVATPADRRSETKWYFVQVLGSEGYKFLEKSRLNVFKQQERGLTLFSETFGDFSNHFLDPFSRFPYHSYRNNYPVLPFLSFEKGKENHQKNKDFLSLPNP